MSTTPEPVPGRNVPMICDGCKEVSEARIRSMPVRGETGRFFFFIRPPRGWYVTEEEVVPEEGDSHKFRMMIGVCPRCVEKQTPLGHDPPTEKELN